MSTLSYSTIQQAMQVCAYHWGIGCDVIQVYDEAMYKIAVFTKYPVDDKGNIWHQMTELTEVNAAHMSLVGLFQLMELSCVEAANKQEAYKKSQPISSPANDWMQFNDFVLEKPLGTPKTKSSNEPNQSKHYTGPLTITNWTVQDVDLKSQQPGVLKTTGPKHLNSIGDMYAPPKAHKNKKPKTVAQMVKENEQAAQKVKMTSKQKADEVLKADWLNEAKIIYKKPSKGSDIYKSDFYNPWTGAETFIASANPAPSSAGGNLDLGAKNKNKI